MPPNAVSPSLRRCFIVLLVEPKNKRLLLLSEGCFLLYSIEICYSPIAILTLNIGTYFHMSSRLRTLNFHTKGGGDLQKHLLEGRSG